MTQKTQGRMVHKSLDKKGKFCYHPGQPLTAGPLKKGGGLAVGSKTRTPTGLCGIGHLDFHLNRTEQSPSEKEVSGFGVWGRCHDGRREGGGLR